MTTAVDDRTRAASMLSAVGGQPEYLVTIPGAPYAKSRPRGGRHGFYSNPEDVRAERFTATHLRSVVRAPYSGNVAVACVFYRPDRRVMDADNMFKHLSDAANHVLWVDDSQCTGTAAVVELDRQNPRTVVAVGPHTSSLRRGTDHTNQQEKDQ